MLYDGFVQDGVCVQDNKPSVEKSIQASYPSHARQYGNNLNFFSKDPFDRKERITMDWNKKVKVKGEK